MPLNIVKKST